jgi:F-type H+-transporting ATPase subunit b
VTGILAHAETWVVVATVIFIGILMYAGVHKQILAGVDARREQIEAELAEAKRLKDEALALVAEYQRKQKDAEKEAEALIQQARDDADRYAVEAKQKMDDFVTRRTRMAETKIAQAEHQAIADVRAAAADAAVTAASDILSLSAKGKVAEDLIAQGIRDVKAKLN